MAERGEYNRFNDALTEDENAPAPEFGAEEQDKVESILKSLDDLIITEDNESLVADIKTLVKSAKDSYENSNKTEAWDELWVRLSEEVLGRLIDEDYDAVETNWDDIKLELMRLRNN